MPATTEEILNAADKLGRLIAEHPAMKKYQDAQRAMAEDPEASRLSAELERVFVQIAQQEQMGQPPTEQQRQRFEQIQQTLATNLKVKAFSIAQYDLTDILRKASQAWQRPVAEAQGTRQQQQAQTPQPAGPRLVTPF